MTNDLLYRQALEEARQYDAGSKHQAAVKTLLDALESCEADSKKHLYFELGKYYFNYNEPEKSVDMLFKALGAGYNKDAIDIFVQRYFDTDNVGKSVIYSDNTALLKDYPYLHTDLAFEATTHVKRSTLYSDKAYTISQDENLSVSYIKTEDDPIFITEQVENTVILLVNPKSFGQAFAFEQYSRSLEKRKVPFYIYFSDMSAFAEILTYTNVDCMLKHKRVVILVGIKALQTYFADSQAFLPNAILDYSPDSAITQNIMGLRKSREERMLITGNALKAYYDVSQNTVYSNIASDKMKLMFLTSRFHSTTDTMNAYIKASKKRGYVSGFVSEKSDISANGDMEYIFMEKSLPDMLFGIDTFRADRPLMPPEPIFLTLLNSTDGIDIKSMLQRLGQNDFIFANGDVCYTLFTSGAKKHNIIEMPLIADKTIQIGSKLANVPYQCDVCVIADESNPSKFLPIITDSARQALSEKSIDTQNLDKVITEINSKYLAMFYIEKIPNNYKENEDIILSAHEKYGVDVTDDYLNTLTEKFRIHYCRRLYNLTLANWLVRAGLERIKLWGAEWRDQAHLTNYAIGAMVSEISLAKAVSAAKIVIGNDLFDIDYCTMYSAISCGALYMQNNMFNKKEKIYSEYNLRDGAEIAYFSTKEAFIRKIKGYLDNPQERQRVVSSAQGRIKYEPLYGEIFSHIIGQVKKRIPASVN